MDFNHIFNNEFSSNSNFDLNTRLQYLSKSTPQCLAILSQLWLWLLIECQLFWISSPVLGNSDSPQKSPSANSIQRQWNNNASSMQIRCKVHAQIMAKWKQRRRKFDANSTEILCKSNAHTMQIQGDSNAHSMQLWYRFNATLMQI